MHSDRELTRIVRSWMEEGATALPDRVLDAVLDQVPTTPQRRPWWPSRRTSDMNTPLKVAIVAAAVLVVAIAGFNLMPRSSGPGALPGASTATASPSPAPVLPVGPLDPGTYRFDDPDFTAVPFTLTVPAGWAARSDGSISKNADSPGEVGVSPWIVTHVYEDACAAKVPTEVGPTVDDLLDALADQQSSDRSAPVEVTLGGYPATRVDVSIPAGLDTLTCAPGGLIQVWADRAETTFFAIPGEQAGAQFPVYVADVDGKRAVFQAGGAPGASASDLAELQTIIDSITFVP